MDTVTHVPELLSARKSHPFTFPGGFLKDFFFFTLPGNFVEWLSMLCTF